MKRKLAVLGAMALCLSSVTLTSTAFASDTVLTTQALAEPIPVPTEELVDAEPGCYMKIVSEPDKTVYHIGDELDLTGLKIDVIYAPGGEMPISQINNNWMVVIDAENPLENENFIVDTSEFDSSKAGEYNIKVSLTDDAMSYKWWYCQSIDIPVIVVEDDTIKGDVNADGKFTVADVVMLQKWLLGVPDVTFANWKAADLCEDGTLDVFDLCMMKRELVNSVSEPTKQTIYSEKRIDIIGYSEELFKLSSTEESEAVLTSSEELEDYLLQITEKRVIGPMLDKYNDAFFNDNVLLVKCISQSCGGEGMYQIDSVQYEKDSLVVNYSDNYGYEDYIDVVNGLLAQVVIPKGNYHADSVEWRFTSYFDMPLLLINDDMVIESPDGWREESYERVITADGNRYSKQLCDCVYYSFEDQLSHIKSKGEKEQYIDLTKDYNILQMIIDLSKNASKYKNCDMITTSDSVADYGQMRLSVLYKDENGTMQSLELYRYGEECAMLNDADVHYFIRTLVDKDYIDGFKSIG